MTGLFSGKRPAGDPSGRRMTGNSILPFGK